MESEDENLNKLESKDYETPNSGQLAKNLFVDDSNESDEMMLAENMV